MSTTSTTHPVSPEELMALLDGELSADRAQSVSAHTESCAECQKALASLRNVTQQVSNWRVGVVPHLRLDANAGGGRKSAKGWPMFGSLPKLGTTRVLGWTAAIATGIAFLFAISGPNLHRSRMDANEASSVRSLRPIDALTKAVDPMSGGRTVDDAAVQGRQVQQSVITALGTVGDSNGLAGGRGVHAQNSFSVDGQAISGPMIARTVSLAILVKDFDANRKALDSILLRYNGYAASLSVSTPQGAARSLQASLRIPALQLPAALAELKALGHVENENQNGEEVTQQHADLVARLKNSRETEQRLQAILVQRTGKISDVLEVEQEIARVRGEIEQMEAEQKNLEHRVDFATIDLRLSEEYKVKLDSAVPSFGTQFHNALVNGYRNVADTLVALILFFAEYGPILLFWIALLGTPAWLLWRRWRQATAAAPAL